MSWAPLYVDILTGDFLGNSLSTFNSNFSNIDAYLSTLENDFSANFLKIDQYLSDLSDVPSAVLNLGFGSIAELSASSGTNAWVIFNGTSYSKISGENRCSIVSTFNVDKVVRVSAGLYDIYYSSTLPHIGAIIGNCNGMKTVLVDYSTGVEPTTTKCRIATYSVGSSGLLGDASYINIISY